MYRVAKFHLRATCGAVGKGSVFHLPRPLPVASSPDHFFIGSEGEEDQRKVMKKKRRRRTKREKERRRRRRRTKREK